MHNSAIKTVFSWALLVLVCLASFSTTAGGGEPLVFPWGTPSTPDLSPINSAVGYQILPRGEHHHAPLPVRTAAPKTAYAYGWFGSNPIPYAGPSWGRHFGYSQNFTQWTSR